MDNTKLIAEHKAEKLESTQYKERKFVHWNENYFLYRDYVTTNRLTQRQPVNIPIMRETIQTWISKIDEPPLLSFESRTKDNASKDGEIVLNELWAYTFDREKLDIKDNLDKKVVGLQGRSFKKWGWANNWVFCDIIDPYDIDIAPKSDPLNINSAPWVIHKNIFKPLRTILANTKYEAEGKQMLKTFLDSNKGLIKTAETQNEWEMRQDRLKTLGAYNFDEFRATDVMVEINESYKMIWDKEKNQFVRYLIVIGADNAVLYKKPLEKAIGINIIPIVSWADDPDLNDQWPDGKGDSVRTVNKVVNLYFSQDLENRTYRNFGMYFFNTLNGKFQPRAFDPKPFGMYGVPGNPEEMVKQMQINPLPDTAASITFLKDMIQSSVAQTPTERGVANPSTKTLGEVQLNLKQSTGRNEVTAKNYRRAWKESGEIFYQLINANSNGKITLYKKGNDGEYRSKDIYPSNWKNPAGYECKVVMKSEKEADDQFALEKAAFIRNNFQDNPIAIKLGKKKQLELLGWLPDEIQQVMDYEDQKLAALSNAGQDPNAVVDPNDPNAAQDPNAMVEKKPIKSPYIKAAA